MTDLRRRIREALRDADEERLSIDEAAAMRRVVVAAVRAREEHAGRSFQPLAVAATLVAMIGLGVAVGDRFERRIEDLAATNAADESQPAARRPEGARQLQFSTPGGTRIIWIFNSDLDLKTAP